VTRILIERQLAQRQKIQEQIQPIIEEHKLKLLHLKQDIARYMELGGSPPKSFREEFSNRQQDQDIDYTPEI